MYQHPPTGPWLQGRGGLSGALLQTEWGPWGSSQGLRLPVGQQHQREGPRAASGAHARVQPIGVRSSGLRQLEQPQPLVRLGGLG